jgi:hypothetical protein
VKRLAVTLLAVLFALPATAEEKIGIFETIYHSNASFTQTAAAIEAAAADSSLQLHGSLDVRVPDDAQQAKVFVLTSPNFVEAARAEVPRTISAQILRIAVFTWGDEQKTVINMANPVAHAMVYYADSPNYDELIAAAGATAGELRQLVTAVPGEAVSVQVEPIRKEKHYNKYKGDGPARMMTKFRTWDKSQLLIEEPVRLGDRHADPGARRCRVHRPHEPVHRKPHGAHQFEFPGQGQDRESPVSRRGSRYGAADRSADRPGSGQNTCVSLRPDVAHAALLLGLRVPCVHGERECARQDLEFDRGRGQNTGRIGRNACS